MYTTFIAVGLKASFGQVFWNSSRNTDDVSHERARRSSLFFFAPRTASDRPPCLRFTREHGRGLPRVYLEQRLREFGEQIKRRVSNALRLAVFTRVSWWSMGPKQFISLQRTVDEQVSDARSKNRRWDYADFWTLDCERISHASLNPQWRLQTSRTLRRIEDIWKCCSLRTRDRTKRWIWSCFHHRLRTITSDQTVCDNSSLSLWTRRYDIAGQKWLKCNKFITCFALLYTITLVYIKLNKIILAYINF